MVACAVWSKFWWDHIVKVHCDNSETVAVINSGYSRKAPIMHLLRCLFFIRATYQFSLYTVHVPGALNWWVDALSWGNVSFLYTQGETVTYQQTTVPESLITLLIAEQPNWTSHRWIQLYRDCLQQV